MKSWWGAAKLALEYFIEKLVVTVSNVVIPIF